MANVNAKCTNCGENILIDDVKDADICPHCNTAFVTEKAIKLYNQTPEQIQQNKKTHQAIRDHRLKGTAAQCVFCYFVNHYLLLRAFPQKNQTRLAYLFPKICFVFCEVLAHFSPIKSRNELWGSRLYFFLDRKESNYDLGTRFGFDRAKGNRHVGSRIAVRARADLTAAGDIAEHFAQPPL